MKRNLQKKTLLYTEIKKAYESLLAVVDQIPQAKLHLKEIPFIGGLVSVCDILAYQIGWGTLLIHWYKAGSKNKLPEMPMKGFSWDYEALALHFFEKHSRNSPRTLKNKFQKTVFEILDIVSKEQLARNLDKVGVWDWCTLRSGKKWTLSKWVQINSVAPYKRATKILRKHFYIR